MTLPPVLDFDYGCLGRVPTGHVPRVRCRDERASRRYGHPAWRPAFALRRRARARSRSHDQEERQSSQTELPPEHGRVAGERSRAVRRLAAPASRFRDRDAIRVRRHTRRERGEVELADRDADCLTLPRELRAECGTDAASSRDARASTPRRDRVRLRPVHRRGGADDPVLARPVRRRCIPCENEIGLVESAARHVRLEIRCSLAFVSRPRGRTLRTSMATARLWSARGSALVGRDDRRRRCLLSRAR